MKRNAEMHEAVRKQLGELGAGAISFGKGGAHDCVSFIYKGLVIHHGFPSTHSDHRSVKNTCSDIRRRCREIDNRRAMA